jgi:hypothetical protein
VGLPEPIARLLEAGPERLLEQRENPTRILWPHGGALWPHGGAGAGLPVLEFHEEPLPP